MKQKPGASPPPAPPTTTPWWRKKGNPSCRRPMLQPGDRCPACEHGRLAYDGLFLLTCIACGKIAEGGAFT